MAIATRMTLEEFLKRPDIDERRLELIEGEVHPKMSPTWRHSAIALQIGIALDPFGAAGVEPRAVIPPGDSDPGGSLLPDLAFYRDNPPEGDTWMDRAPHVAVEVRSPGQSRSSLRLKAGRHLRFGVESVWIIDPTSLEVEVLESDEHRSLGLDEVITSASVPGFSLAVRDLFLRARVLAR